MKSNGKRDKIQMDLNVVFFIVFIVLFLIFAAINGRFLSSFKNKGAFYSYKSLFTQNILPSLLFVFILMGIFVLLVVWASV